MQKTRIEWVRNPDGSQGYTWNPIRGLCPVNCKTPDGKEYCYAMRMYQRFKWNPEIRLDCEDKSKFGTALSIKIPRKPSKIFVCSTIELFHPKIKKHWRDWIFREIEQNPQHTFQILTKFPQNIDRPMPDNVWLGTTVTNQRDLYRIVQMERIEAKKRFISFEPLLEFINWEGFTLEFSSLDWIIVGRLTGHGKKYEPKKYWINQIKFYAGYYGIPLFMKDNLKEIWRENLIQEMPE